MLKTNGLLAAMLLSLLAMTGITYGVGDEPGTVPAVEELSLSAKQSVFDDATRDKPLELKSAEDAKAYFSDDQLKVLNKNVDWDKQTVLVFAWRGSGQDKMEAKVHEKGDDGLLVEFVYTAGRTRDLREHTRFFAVRKGVAWKRSDGKFGR